MCFNSFICCSRRQLTVERDLLESLLLDNAQNRLEAVQSNCRDISDLNVVGSAESTAAWGRLRSLSDEELLSLFREVAQAKAPSPAEQEAPRRGIFGRPMPSTKEAEQPRSLQKLAPVESTGVTGNLSVPHRQALTVCKVVGRYTVAEVHYV